MIDELFSNNSKFNNFIQQINSREDIRKVFLRVFNQKEIILEDNEDLPF